MSYLPHRRRAFRGGITSITRTATNTFDPVSGPSITWPALSLGSVPTSGRRYMVASIMAAGPLNLVTVSSITIGGGSDCKISGGLEGYAKTYFAFREVPSGTSGDVVMTFSGSANSDTAHCTLYSIVTGGNTLSNDDFVTAGSTVSTTRTLSGIDVSKNGVLLVHGAHEQAGGGATLGGTGLGSLHEGTVGGAVYAWSGYSSSLYSSAQTISNAAITATTSRTIIGASFS